MYSTMLRYKTNGIDKKLASEHSYLLLLGYEKINAHLFILSYLSKWVFYAYHDIMTTLVVMLAD